jgi:hypothetical protein
MSEMLPWQEEILRRLDGISAIPAKVVAIRPRTYGKHEALVALCALDEMLGRKWDVVGDPDQARRVRREARERAAELQRRLDET